MTTNEKIKIIVIFFVLITLLIYILWSNESRRIEQSAHVGGGKSVVQGFCLVLPEMYCQKVERLDSNRNILAANLEPDVPILSPFDGVVTIGIPASKSGNHYIGEAFYILVSESGQEDLTKKGSVLIAHTGVEEKGIKTGSLVKKGDILARTGKTNIDINEEFKPYNLIVYHRNVEEMFDVPLKK